METYKIKLSDVRVVHAPKIFGYPGTETLSAVHHEYACPIGVVWFRQVNVRQVEILNIYTHQHVRRQGVATSLLSQLQSWYGNNQTLTTASGNAESTGLLKKLGFVTTPDGWFLRPQPTNEGDDYSI